MEDEYDDRSVFESGDQDYGSARGWDPQRERLRALLAADKKKNPRRYSPLPEMLYVREAQHYINSAIEAAPVKQLFGPFWIYSEMAILFAPTGVGKSVLATQIAESLARGVAFAPFDKYAGPKAGPQRVLYLDFELTRDQFTLRYTSPGADGCGAESPYQFSPDLLRAEHFWNGSLIDGYEDFTDMLFEDIEQQITEHRPEVLIVDNITFLSHSSNANASIAFRLMVRLQKLKKERFVSILVLAHTPKRRRDISLTESDLQGSVDLAKVADSTFAMGRSRQSGDLRYLKHIKSRTGRIEHGSENVAVVRLAKFDFASVTQPGCEKVDNFLGFSFEMFDNEENHVQLRSSVPAVQPPPARAAQKKPRHDPRLIYRAQSLAAQGLGPAVIASQLRIPRSTAHRFIKAIEK